MSRRGRASGSLLALLLAIPVAVGVSPASQTSACDPALERPTTNPHRYRLREDRCEGVYVQQVAGATLLAASFTERFEEYDLQSSPSLTIEWAAPSANPVHLRAYGLRRKLYYRMDTSRPAAARSYQWPTDLLAALGIGREDVGLVGWTRHPVGRVERDVHLPLRIGAAEAGNQTRPYTLVLLPGVSLSEVYVSLAAVDGDGRPSVWIQDERPLKYNYYPAERPIDVPLPRPAVSGVYYVQIGATIGREGSLTTELWFYHPPR